MAMDVSKLAIEVTTTGIREASTALGNLSRSAGTTDKRITSLTGNLAKLMMAGGNVTGSISGLTGTMALINAAFQSASSHAAQMAQALAQAQQGMNNLNGATNRASRSLQEKAHWGGVVRTTLKAMTTAALAYVGVNFVSHSVTAADSWMMMTAKLKIATGSMNNARFAQQELFELSQKMRVPVDELTKLFARLAPTMRNNGQSFEDVKGMVEGVSLALKLNGATAGEAASVMLQFSQAMQKGRLDGAEFNAIAENGSLILRALEKETGKNAGVLKKMGSEGKLGIELIQRAVNNALPQWRKDFAELPVTVEDAWTRIKNSWMKAMGEMSEESGLNKGLVKTLEVFQSLIPVVRDELVRAFIAVGEWINENRSSISDIWTQTKGIVSDAWNLVNAITAGAGAAAGLSDNFSVLGFILYSLRLGVAGLQDGFTFIGALILKLGGYIQTNLASPIYNIAVGALKMLVDGFSGLMTILGRGAELVGLGGLSEGLKSAAAFGKDVSASLTQSQIAYKGIGTAMKQQADEALTMLANGEGAVGRLLKEEQKITFEVQKRRELDKNAWAGTGPKLSKEDDAKANKEREKALKAANTELENSLQLYLRLAHTWEGLEKHGKDFDKLTEGQKEQIKIERQLMLVKDETARKALEQALANNLAAQEIEKLIKIQRDRIKAEEDYSKSIEDRIQKETAEAVELERKVATYGMARGEIERLALATEIYTLAAMREAGATTEQIKQQEALIDAMQRRQAAAEALGDKETLTELEKMLDPARAERFGNALEGSFGRAGKALGSMVKALENYGKRESEIEKMRVKAAKYRDTDSKKFGELSERITEKETESRIKSYGEMAGAAKGFFKEGSTGYKVLEAAEKAFRAYEMFMAVQSFLKKSGLLTALTGATQAANATQAASTVASAATEVTAKQGVAQANATAAVSNQGGGDPYTAFFRIAAMAAIMAGLGLAVSGGGGGGAPGGLRNPAGEIETLEERQRRNSTGTVLGDDQAKSESIRRALDTMKDNSNVGLIYTSEMLASLRNIDMKMGGLTASIARASGMTSGKNFNIQTGSNSSGGLFGISGLFGKTVTKEILDTGLLLNGKISDILGGGIRQYLDIQQTTKKSGFFGIGGSTKTKNFREYQGVDDQLTQYISGIFTDISDTIVTAGASLGLSADTMTQKLNDFVMSAEISLKDLRGEDLEKALQAFFSASADQLAMFAAGSFSTFQRAGEGYFETLTRVASSTERAKDAMAGLGISMVSMWDVQNKTGDLDSELVRESLMRAEAGTTLANIMRLLDGSMEDLISSYRELTSLRNTMMSMGMGMNSLSLDLIRGAGGIRELSDAFDSYVENFFTSEEQTAMKMSQLNMEFARLGISVPQSRNAFRNLVSQLMQGGAAGQELAGRVLSLSDVFSEAMELYDETTGQRVTDARDALREAYDRESSALETVREKMQGFADSLREFKDTLIMGDLSPLSTMEKYQKALERYNAVSAAALSGDENAIAEFQNVANELLRYSREVNASGGAYTADFQRVLDATDALTAFTQGQATQAATDLQLMKQQVDALIEIDESVKTVAQAIAELNLILGGPTPTTQNAVTDGIEAVENPFGTTNEQTSPVTGPTGETAAAIQTQQVNRSNESLIAEVQGLRTELRALREEQKVQTGEMIGATFQANDQAADKVVDGYAKAADDGIWRGQTMNRVNIV